MLIDSNSLALEAHLCERIAASTGIVLGLLLESLFCMTVMSATLSMNSVHSSSKKASAADEKLLVDNEGLLTGDPRAV